MKSGVTWPLGTDTPWCWAESNSKRPEMRFLKTTKFIAYMLHLWPLSNIWNENYNYTSTWGKTTQSYATKICSLKSHISKSTIWVLKTFYHPQANSYDLTSFLNQLLQFDKHMAALNATAIKAFYQNSDSTITTTWIKKHWRIWNISHNWNLSPTYLKNLIFQTIF